MKIQRMFSNVEEEKIYSTGNDELDELLERAFCEGYEYAQKEFGRAEREKRREIGKKLVEEGNEIDKKLKERGVSSKDRRTIQTLHQLKNDPEYMKQNEDFVSENPETRKQANKRVTRTSTILTTPIGTVYGSLAGATATRSYKGAIIGAGVGTGVGLTTNTLAHHLRKKSVDSKEKREKGRDRIKVAKGKMSADEFGKKYGKKK